MIRARSEMLAAVRQFFTDRDILEVDCPILSPRASIDAHIDLFETTDGRFLHSSPEYGMKRLLADGAPDIYQLSHVFRKGEAGNKHNPEFTLIEWYRLGYTFDAIINETADLIRLFLGDLSLTTLTYEEAFQQLLNLDFRTKTDDELNILIGTEIEPHLGHGELLALTHYPASQAALAKTNGDFAERFEIYYEGIELCNGYNELTNADEQGSRFKEENRARLALGKDAYPIDNLFLNSLEKLPSCCGVAVGFDRLLMLKLGASTIQEALPFHWTNA